MGLQGWRSQAEYSLTLLHSHSSCASAAGRNEAGLCGCRNRKLGPILFCTQMTRSGKIILIILQIQLLLLQCTNDNKNVKMRETTHTLKKTVSILKIQVCVERGDLYIKLFN